MTKKETALNILSLYREFVNYLVEFKPNYTDSDFTLENFIYYLMVTAKQDE